MQSMAMAIEVLLKVKKLTDLVQSGGNRQAIAEDKQYRQEALAKLPQVERGHYAKRGKHIAFNPTASFLYSAHHPRRRPESTGKRAFCGS